MVEFGSYKFNMVQWGSIGFNRAKFIQFSQINERIMNLKERKI